MERFPLGYNTYSVRALRWHDLQLLEYAASLKLDAVYLQDSIDPGNNDPNHWKELKAAAARLGLELHGGDAGALPRTPDGMDATVKRLREGIRHAVGIGSKLVRFRVAGDRASLPPGQRQPVISRMTPWPVTLPPGMNLKYAPPGVPWLGRFSSP